MKEPIKKEWIKRLRSGDIKQTTTKLGEEDGSRCCLGVLCDIAVEHEIIPEPAPDPDSDLGEDLHYGIGRDRSSGALPCMVARWAGIDTLGELANPNNHVYMNLAEANDAEETFNYIADIIEADLLKKYPHPKISHPSQ